MAMRLFQDAGKRMRRGLPASPIRRARARERLSLRTMSWINGSAIPMLHARVESGVRPGVLAGENAVDERLGAWCRTPLYRDRKKTLSRLNCCCAEPNHAVMPHPLMGVLIDGVIHRFDHTILWYAKLKQPPSVVFVVGGRPCKPSAGDTTLLQPLPFEACTSWPSAERKNACHESITVYHQTTTIHRSGITCRGNK